MPELPEVETVCRGIAPHIIGEKVVATVVRQAKLRWPVAQPLYHLQGEKILQVQRRAKYLLIQLESGWIIIHLGMSGTLQIVSTGTSVQKHDHIDLLLSNQYTMRFNDARRFGFWLWSEDPLNHPLLKNLGVEPLDPAFDGAYLHRSLQGKKRAIKPWLMDNRVVVGIGNIYASEALYRAALAPQRLGNTLTESQAERLAIEISQVLREAIVHGGSTLRDFKGADGKAGYFAQQLRVYGRAEEPCYGCNTPIIRFIQGQRATFSCPKCQL